MEIQFQLDDPTDEVVSGQFVGKREDNVELQQLLLGSKKLASPFGDLRGLGN
ncbi:hypothetical protein PF005_g9562 [Phytophthora fragariae]|uniref:Uncharacterized protein n=1 Tax=Phytophthora fragariae TaxID=53985 RepID=A0A6A3ZV77_9STRA|nr:hypothetical protein PF003_g18401 [Phytophthora fragariae]KAE8944612.1 hypothetical protein PF009_g5719 [Phytophthora fragariae]KAE9006774.1 hypothetical protein PF011_g11422 [Phytophthora fragariae]KAE9107926.1 hypothetical protein PF010_g12094 [Phytophthora fragariae]KAE9120904.1 hypothetical protein PF007_g8001 [Phytophthora fragariae]